jgi:hypothetical protein
MATEAPVYVCRVNGPGGPQDLVTVLSPEVVSAEGLAPEAVVGICARLLGEEEPISPALFAQNRGFVNLLHWVIAEHGPSLPGVQSAAARQGEGWVYVIDARTPDPSGDVPTQDVLGAFAVREGVIVAESYQRNPNHILLSERGFFRLDPELHRRLLHELEKLGPRRWPRSEAPSADEGPG